MKKKVVSIILVLALAVGLLALSGCGGEDKTKLYVYNWGVNIADGTDDYIDVIELFEEAYPEIDVVYDTYDTNEALYTRLSGGGVSYDVIIPSDYMIARMIREDMLLPLNYDNIPNYELVDDTFKNQATTPITSTPCPTPGAPSASFTTPSMSTRPTSAAGTCSGTRSTPARLS